MRKKTVLIITLFVFTLLTTSTQAIPINKPFSQRENDSLAINLQQEPYLNDYPISAHYFQGMRSPGFSGDEGWSDYSFYRGTHRDASPHFKYHLWRRLHRHHRSGFFKFKFARFNREDDDYLLEEAMVPTEIDESINSYVYPEVTLINQVEIPGGNEREISSTPVPEPATILLLSSGIVGLAGFYRKKFNLKRPD